MTQFSDFSSVSLSQSLSSLFVFTWHAGVCCFVWFATPQPHSSLDNEGKQYLRWEGEGHYSVWNIHALLVSHPCSAMQTLMSQQKQLLYDFWGRSY